MNVLNAAGYEAYNVNRETFDEVQIALSTDLNALNLDPDCSYIIIITGDQADITLNGASSTFTHTYNGKTYLMRYFTITAADDPQYGKASTVNVLNSRVKDLIKNCLDTAISAYISSINNVLGTVASICGLSVSNFGTTQTSTLNVNCGTNWTRVYTQVWSDYDNAWLFGSCVEYVSGSAYMSGQYYSASQNKYIPVPPNAVSKTVYSSNYYNYEWRKNYAVIGYINSWIQYNAVGDVKYIYGNRTIVTHKENF